MLVKDEMGMLEDLKEEVEEVEEECYEAAAIQMPTIPRKRSSMGKHQFAYICVNANVMWKFSVRCGGDGCPRSEVHVCVSGCLWVGGCWGGGGGGGKGRCVCSCLRACVYVMPMFHAIWKPRAVCTATTCTCVLWRDNFKENRENCHDFIVLYCVRNWEGISAVENLVRHNNRSFCANKLVIVSPNYKQENE